MSRFGVARLRMTLGALAGLLVVGSTACSDDPPNAGVATTLASVPATTIASDRTLRIGLLLPLTGPGAAIGASLTTAAELAVDQIDAAGGVFGRSVQLLTQDEGADTATAAASLDALLDANVDAIIGPASSTTAYAVLSRAIKANVLVCSPTASAIGLTDFPDNRLFFRTMPSDAVQAGELARAIERTGQQSTVIVASDDSYGDDFALSLAQHLGSIPFEVEASLRYDPLSDDLSGIAQQAADTEAGSIAVIGSGDSGAAMLAAVRATGTQAQILVNDAFLDPDVSAALGDTAANILEGVTGVAVDARPTDTAFVEALHAKDPTVSTSFAGFAFDCANVIALAAVAAENDAAIDLSAELVGLTTSGDECETFAACSEKLRAGLNVDLHGPSGELDLNRFGDVASSGYGTFTFDDTGRAVRDS